MPIFEDNIKLLASERLSDNDDGGGRVTYDQIVDNEENNVFPDVSSDDRAGGRVRIRKVYSAVDTTDDDLLLGARAIISDDSDDPNITAALFTTDSWTDERTQAREYVERYLFSGPLSALKLLYLHVEGQRQILAYQPVGAPLPQVGDVLVLSEENGATIIGEQQYIRVIDVQAQQVTYTDDQGDFVRTEIRLEISDPLRRDFLGAAPSRLTSSQPPVKMRVTNPVDAASFKGVWHLADQGSLNDLTVKAESIFTRVVPSTQGSAPIIDAQLPSGAVSIVSGPETFEIIGPSNTASIKVDVNNRGFNYVFLCQPVPSPGSLVIEFRAQGRWYSIFDDGTGVLTGSGSGVINYATGSVAVTLDALPDVPSAVLASWSATTHYSDRAGTAVYDPVSISYALQHAADKTAGVTVTWIDSGSIARSATAGGNGVFSGDAAGTIVYETGELFLTVAHSALPAAAAIFSVAYDRLTRQQQTLTADVSGATASLMLSNTPIKPGSVRVRAPYKSAYERAGGVGGLSLNSLYVRDYFDDGAGTLIGPDGNGTVNYSTGEVTILGSVSRTVNKWYRSDGWITDTQTVSLSGVCECYYQLNTATPSATTEPLPMGPLTVRLLPGLRDFVVPGTLRFSIGGQAFSDRAGQGQLYLADGTPAGTVDYAARVATITNHTIQAQPNADVVLTSMVSTFGDWIEYEYNFRTPGSPLTPGSLIVSATATDGELLVATTDFNGNIIGGFAEGTADQQSGVVYIRFGVWQPDASLTAEQKAEPWYNPANIVNGDYFVPRFVYPNTVRFNCVVQTYLPLDADLLGLDPVRLPSDGKVPAIRKGDRAVVHHTDSFVLPNPAQPGATYNLGRDRVAWLRVYDQAGALVPADRYTSDLIAGTLTMVTNLNLSGYVQPLVAKHTVKDESTVTDVQISGVVTLAQPLSHVYPANEARISTALRHGDMGARITVPFAQSTWTGTWSDTLQGAAATAQYDNTNHPIVTTNAGSLGYRDRYRLNFTSSTSYQLISESRGVLATGTTTQTFTFTNPLTGEAVMTLNFTGFGTGWQPGNQLRFNIEDATYPYWLLHCVQPGPALGAQDRIQIEQLGDVDA